MTGKRGKGEPIIPDVAAYSDEKLVEEFSSTSNWYDWATSAQESRYYDTYHATLRKELLKRLTRE